MSPDRALDADLNLEQRDAEGVKGGGIVDAEVSVSGVGSASVHDTNTSASAFGTSAGTSTSGSGYSANARAGGTSANAKGRKPRTRRALRKK